MENINNEYLSEDNLLSKEDEEKIALYQEMILDSYCLDRDFF